jgi:predicted ATP-grasp superfamily ATP-dependent carboligase
VDPIVFTDRPSMDRPILITAFRGWNDAGESATAAATFLKDAWDGTVFARIDPEEFFDFQVTRPVVRLTDGVSRVIEWPSCEFHHANVAGRDVVVFVGGEPNVRWRTFATAIVDMARSLSCERLITLGAFLADVAHTRPVPVVGSAATPEEAQRLDLATSRYEGPTGIVGVLHDLSNRAGVPSVSFWAAVPHYVPAGVNPKAALSLVERVASFLQFQVSLDEILPAVAAWEQRVSELVGENEALADYVHRLEEVTTEAPPLPLVSGESLAAELERFLRERDGGREG